MFAVQCRTDSYDVAAQNINVEIAQLMLNSMVYSLRRIQIHKIRIYDAKIRAIKLQSSNGQLLIENMKC